MKQFLTVAVICLLLAAACSQNDGHGSMAGPTQMFHVGLIRTGPTWDGEQSEETTELQKAHLTNITRLAQAGDLALAGPFVDDSGKFPLAGLFVYNVTTSDEARALANTDPAVQAGRLAVDTYPWLGYGPIVYDEPFQMRMFVTAFYRRGPALGRTAEFDATVLETQARSALAPDSIEIAIAGQFATPANDSLLAMHIYDADSVQSVRSRIDSLPAVKASLVAADVILWYGPSGLRFGEVNATDPASRH